MTRGMTQKASKIPISTAAIGHSVRAVAETAVAVFAKSVEVSPEEINKNGAAPNVTEKYSPR